MILSITYLSTVVNLVMLINFLCCDVGDAQQKVGNATGFNGHISYLNNKQNPKRKEKLISATSEYPLSFYSVKDASGKVIRKEGLSSLIFWWIADRYGYNAELLEIIVTYPYESNTTLPITYKDVQAGKIDVVLGFFVMTVKRHQLIDFTHPFFFEPLTLILPDPALNSDVWSVWKALQVEVWIGTFLSILVLSIIFWVFQLLHSSVYERHRKRNKKKNVLKNAVFNNGFIYIVRVLLNQGSYCSSTSLGVRLLAGVWCFAAFVLVYTYNSTLTAHLMIYRPQPIIKSIYDLVNNSNVQLLVKNRSGTDFLISTTEKGLYKQLGDMLQSNPKSRCATDKECLNLVRTGSFVYANPEFAAFDAMANEYNSTKKCEFTVIREYSLAISMAFFTAKSSPVLETINRGILSMSASGITNDWISHHRSTLPQCPNTDFAKLKLKKEKEARKSRLSMRHFLGAFVLLAIGYSLSFLAFLCEIVFSRVIMQQNKKKKERSNSIEVRF